MSAKPDVPHEVLKWTDDTRLEDLNKLYQDTRQKVQGNIGWYTRNAKTKKRGAQLVRWVSLLLLGIGSILPVIIDIFGLEWRPSAATVILAAGTGLIALDRYMGFSTGWMRFITNELYMKGLLEKFEYEWEKERISWNGAIPSIEQTLRMAARCEDIRAEVTQVVQDETQLWVQEFQSNLRFLDENFKTLMESNKPGAVALTVENGECCGHGWKLYIDDRLIGTYSGKTTAVPSLIPGKHMIMVVPLNASGELRQFSVTDIIEVEPNTTIDKVLKLTDNLPD